VNLAVTPKVWWFYWVALGWSAGVLAQGACVFLKKRRKTSASPPQQSETEQIETKTEPSKAKPPRKRVPSPKKPKA
jgi:hypothetical protein